MTIDRVSGQGQGQGQVAVSWQERYRTRVRLREVVARQPSETWLPQRVQRVPRWVRQGLVAASWLMLLAGLVVVAAVSMWVDAGY